MFILNLIAGIRRVWGVALQACFPSPVRQGDDPSTPSTQSSLTSLHPKATFALVDTSYQGSQDPRKTFANSYDILLRRVSPRYVPTLCSLSTPNTHDNLLIDLSFIRKTSISSTFLRLLVSKAHQHNHAPPTLETLNLCLFNALIRSTVSATRRYIHHQNRLPHRLNTYNSLITASCPAASITRRYIHHSPPIS